MSSLWKLNGTGGANSQHSCLYCTATKEERQSTGMAKFDLSDPNNWRKDLKEVFGCDSREIHFCSLHAKTRIVERLTKVMAVEVVHRKKAALQRVINAKSQEKRTKDALAVKAKALEGRARTGLTGKRQAARSGPPSQAVVDAHAAAEAAHAEAKAEVADALADKDALGCNAAFEKAMTSTGVIRTWHAEEIAHKSGDGVTLKVSTLTGPQCEKLLGMKELAAGAQPPYIECIEAAYGKCEHNLANPMPSLEASRCSQCNTAFLFSCLGREIIPVLEAPTVDKLNAAHVALGRSEFDLNAYAAAVQQWGRVYTHTYYKGGARSVVSDYIHIVVEHSAYLLQKGGPLGFWSQQGFEAAHKRKPPPPQPPSTTLTLTCAHTHTQFLRLTTLAARAMMEAGTGGSYVQASKS